ncbi:hypothetical protein LJC60_11175, partial [Ruminococcaceae bacterium OttesenSCG-928-D13]|nr:hypothetical protein [Ruminococcaceae bacterium OttesenSCG-928-D13]
AGGVPVDDILGFVGVTSQNYSDNGGLVMVIQAKPGMAASVEAGVESFKASRQDDRYTEFATQVANTKEGRVRTSGDIVVLAVSASGDWDKLDAALDAALA